MNFRNMPTSPQLKIANSFFSCVVFLFASIGFSVSLLVSHGVVDDEISFYFHISRFENREFVVGKESPVAICLVASIVYFILSCMSFRRNLSDKTSLAGDVVDAFFFPLLLSALVMLTDFLHIIFMFVLYGIYSIGIYDITLCPDTGDTVWVHLMTLYAYAGFWTGYLTGLILNLQFSKPGSGVVEVFVFIFVFGYNSYKVLRGEKMNEMEPFIKTCLRLGLLSSVFIQELRG